MAAKKRATPRPAASWYKDAVIYELHVRAFCRSRSPQVSEPRSSARSTPFSIIAEVRCADGKKKSGEGVLFDAVADFAFRDALLSGIREGRRIRGRSGEIRMTAAAFLTAELETQPQWAVIPLRAIVRLLENKA